MSAIKTNTALPTDEGVRRACGVLDTAIFAYERHHAYQDAKAATILRAAKTLLLDLRKP
jgi:hypothetical protein